MLIFGLNFHMLMQNRARMVSMQITDEIATTVAETCLDLTSQLLKEALRDHRNSLFQTLTADWQDFNGRSEFEREIVLETSEGRLKITDLFRPLLEKFARPYGGLDKFKISAKIGCSPQHFHKFIGKFEDQRREKHGLLQVILEVEYQGRKKSMSVWHEIRALSARPEILRRFTLFVGDARHGKAPDRFNLVSSNSAGELEPSSAIPVTFDTNWSSRNWRTEIKGADDNEKLAKFRDFVYNRQGWFYLGGGDITLNLMHSENDAGYSEDFHFYRNPGEPAGRVYKDPEVESAAQQPAAAFHRLSRNYQINNWDMGYYSFKSSDSPAMALLEGIPPAQRRASLLQLFGQRREAAPNVSPSLVFGQVYAGFVRMAVARRRTGCEAGTTVLSDNRRMFPLPYVRPDEPLLFSDVAARMARISAPGNSEGDIYQAAANLALQGGLWPEWNASADPEYRRLMSRPLKRPYNASLDFIRDGNREAHPPGCAVVDRDRHFPEDGALGPESHSPARAGPHHPEAFDSVRSFEGFLNLINSEEDGYNFMGSRETTGNRTVLKYCRTFKGPEQTGASFMPALEERAMLIRTARDATGNNPDGTPIKQIGSIGRSKYPLLRLGTMIYVDGPLEIGNVEILCNGMIVARGDITITGPILDEGSQKRRALLTLCSLSGNIIIKKQAQLVAAFLVALQREVVTETALDLHGGIVMNTFSDQALETWKRAGGHVSYNPILSRPADAMSFHQGVFVDISPYPVFVDY